MDEEYAASDTGEAERCGGASRSSRSRAYLKSPCVFESIDL